MIDVKKNQRAALIITAVFGIIGCSKQSASDQTASSGTVVAVPVEQGVANAATLASNTAEPIAIKVYKDPQCGCCKDWVKNLEANGFKVETMDMPDLSLIKEKYGVKPELQACHTAIVNGYVVEGHVPADLIKKLLKEKPAIAGLAVPGMPQGSPGMEAATKERYNVLTFDRAGRTTVYAQR